MVDNMYNWVTKKRNFIGGQCPHQCSYCSTDSFKKRFPNANKKYSGELRLIEKELEKNEGSGNVIFVQNCSDLFAEGVKSECIKKVLEHCNQFDNTYLFQTKNPERFLEFSGLFPKKSILGTTIESNRDHNLSKAPKAKERYVALGCDHLSEYDKMINIEPILDFDLKELVDMIKHVNPKFVSIGADSKDHNLQEPSPEKVNSLVKEIKKFTEVKVKPNLKRLM